ncbi:MAG TPA: hypothetical protein VHL80_11875 [Polyangia bacterium]|nr:hypothetical protein [Polyangia bacterium]
MRLPLRTRLSAAALLLPLVAFATATGGQWLRCRLTGAVVDACCCDDGDAAATPPAPTVPTASEGDCCDRVVRDVAPAAAELVPPTTMAPRILVGAVLPAPGAIGADDAPPGRVEAHRILAPPTAQQRLITKSTLLI